MPAMIRSRLVAGTCALALMAMNVAQAADTAAPAAGAAAPAFSATSSSAPAFSATSSSAPASGATSPAAPASGSSAAAATATGNAAKPAATASSAAPAAAASAPAVSTGKAPASNPIAAANAVVVPVPAPPPPSYAPLAPALQPALARSAPASASPTVRPMRASTSGEPNVVGSADHSMSLEMGRGELIRLSRPAANVFVADPNIANVQVKSPTVIYVFGVAAGDTNIYALDDQDGVLLNVGIQVTHNLSRLKETLAQAVPDSDVKVTTSGNSLILSGTVRNPTQAADVKRIAARFVSDDKQLVNNVSVDAPTQVNLRVRVAEISRDVQKTFGINWSTGLKIGNFMGALATGNPVLASQVVSSGVSSGLFAPQTAGTSTIAGAVTAGADLNFLINALETENLVSVLAEPNLTALSGETASFLAGGEYPVPAVQSGTSNNAITVSFKTYGVQLAFTPTILDSGRINLRVRPEVSQLSSEGAVTVDGITVDALTTRRADTTVELGSGQSLAIGGLLQHNVNESISKFPWLADIPVIGALLRSENFQRNETELVIVVTPYIVRPASDRKFVLPNDGFYAPNDIDRVIGGKTFRQQLQAGRQASVMPNGATRLIGPVGFEME